MSLIKKKTTTTNYPKSLLTYGAPKVGKTTALSMLDGALIIDLEDGTSGVTGNIVNTKQLIKEGYEGTELNIIRDVYNELSESNPYNYIIFDTVDQVEFLVAQEIQEEYEVESYGDIPYGKGYGLLRDRTLRLFNTFKDLGLIVIIIGHRKKTIIGSEGNEVKVNDLDLTGKLKNYLFAWADAIGYWNRTIDEEGNTTTSLSFIINTDENSEAGCRISSLEGKNIPITYKDKTGIKANWKAIFPIKE